MNSFWLLLFIVKLYSQINIFKLPNVSFTLTTRTNDPIPRKCVGNAHIKGWRYEQMGKQILIYIAPLNKFEQRGIP